MGLGDMNVVDVCRFTTVCPELAQRVQACRLPGEYLLEYLSYTISNGDVVSNTAYFHEPEWLGDSNSKQQRREVAEYIRTITDLSDDILRPDGEFIRIDPSFKSSDTDAILRLEMLFNSHDVYRQKCYMRSLITWACGDGICSFVEERLPGGKAYHCAVAFDVVVRKPVALRFYFRLPKETGKEFSGVTISATGRVLSRKVYWLPSGSEIKALKLSLPYGFSPAYMAEEETPTGNQWKVYLFNDLWNTKKGAENERA